MQTIKSGAMGFAAMIDKGHPDAALQGNLTFGIEGTDATGMSWVLSEGGRKTTFSPRIIPTAGVLLVGGVFIAAGQGSEAVVLRDVKPEPASVVGTIRFPSDHWTPFGEMFVKGGGIEFDETGIFLVSGTVFAK